MVGARKATQTLRRDSCAEWPHRVQWRLLADGGSLRNWADVAELADAIDLGSIARQGVEVRVLSSAPGADGGPWPSGKASPLHGEDRRFESDRVHLVARTGSAQQVQQDNGIRGRSSVVERFLAKEKVVSSNLIARSRGVGP